MLSDTPAKKRRLRKTTLPFSVIFRLARRNVLRHRSRAATALGAIAFGVAGLILSQGFVEDIFVKLAEAIVHSQSGHIQVGREGFFQHGSHQPEKYVVDDPEGDKRKIMTIPEVKDAMARLSFSGLLNNGKADVSVIGEGIEADKEEQLGTSIKITHGRQLKKSDEFGALVGHGVAQTLRLKPGDRATIVMSTSDGAMNSMDFEVVGVFQSFSKDYDNHAIKIPLAAAQQLLNTKGANTIVVSLHSTADTVRVARLLRERTIWRDQSVMTWEELNDFYPKTVEMYRMQFGALQGIILLLVILSVVNAVNSTVFERTSEFGTARALGNRGRNVLTLVLTENALLGLIGGLLGIVVGVVLAELLSRVGISMPPPPNSDLGYDAQITLTAPTILRAFAVGTVATMLGALIPAIRVSSIQIAMALRQNS
ncbi:MAG: FtsX-like permease family protein [Burkholderiales bacterium]